MFAPEQPLPDGRKEEREAGQGSVAQLPHPLPASLSPLHGALPVLLRTGHLPPWLPRKKGTAAGNGATAVGKGQKGRGADPHGMPPVGTREAWVPEELGTSAALLLSPQRRALRKADVCTFIMRVKPGESSHATFQQPLGAEQLTANLHRCHLLL